MGSTPPIFGCAMKWGRTIGRVPSPGEAITINLPWGIVTIPIRIFTIASVWDRMVMPGSPMHTVSLPKYGPWSPSPTREIRGLQKASSMGLLFNQPRLMTPFGSNRKEICIWEPMKMETRTGLRGVCKISVFIMWHLPTLKSAVYTPPLPANQVRW